jgi:hypothetical protein
MKRGGWRGRLRCDILPHVQLMQLLVRSARTSRTPTEHRVLHSRTAPAAAICRIQMFSLDEVD